MATSPLRLYRTLLRVGQSWKGNPKERAYILDTTREEFRKNLRASSSEAQALVNEAETRLAMGLHYDCPYPRADHLGGGGAEGITHYKQNVNIARGRKKINVNGKAQWYTPPPGSDRG